MSGKVTGEVWALDLPRPEQWVLLAMADNAHDDGSKCHPGLNYLEWKTGYSRRQLQRILHSLEGQNLLEPVAYASGGRGMATEYHIHTANGKPKPPYRKNGDILSRKQKGDIQEQKGDISGQKGDTQVTPLTSYEPSYEPSVMGTPAEAGSPQKDKEPENPDPAPSRAELEKTARGMIEDFLEIHPAYALPVATFIARVQAKEKIQSMTAVRRWRDFYAVVAQARVDYSDKAALYALEWSNRQKARNMAYFKAVLKDKPQGAATSDYMSPKEGEASGTHKEDGAAGHPDDWFFD